MQKETKKLIDNVTRSLKPGSHPGLSRVQKFCELCGHPEQRIRTIHVAGTNGKGSVCSFLYSMLQSMGKKCGLFTSPHLTDIKERIQLNGRKATEDEFFQGFSFVWETLKEFQKETGHEEYHPSFFEMLFFVAMVVFENSDLEYLVMETGLGGRLDTTNIVKKPIACVITKIGYDHMEYLGDTWVSSCFVFLFKHVTKTGSI